VSAWSMTSLARTSTVTETAILDTGRVARIAPGTSAIVSGCRRSACASMPVITLRLTDLQMEIVRIAATTRGQSLQVWVSRACDAAAMQQAMREGGDLKTVLDRTAGVESNGAPTTTRAARRKGKRGSGNG
jgi:hypothetical protein